jgi:hypothetical protein
MATGNGGIYGYNYRINYFLDSRIEQGRGVNYFALDDVSISTTIPTTCLGTFYDSGGVSNYSNDEDRVNTYCANYG